MSACGDASGPTREQLVAEFPTVERGSTRPENPEILCPFVRMLERSGLLDQTLAEQETLEVSTTELTAAADVFGCAPLECGTVAATVAVGQPGAAGVDIGRLHQAAGIAHDCGLTFAKGATQVTEARRQATLDRLALLADEQGRLTYPDLLEVKLATCAEEDVTITGAGRTETKLIFAYLGGVDNGYITLYDVESFLYASMPAVKTRYEVDLGLLSKVR
ncbi:MAG: hypothetical protein CML06_11555 [Pseudomonadales bacterium]|nr:hypothetical protein [Pseudomonadales bacterium]